MSSSQQSLRNILIGKWALKGKHFTLLSIMQHLQSS